MIIIIIIIMVPLIEIEKRNARIVKAELDFDFIIDLHCDESLGGRFLFMEVRKLLQQG
jgi:hypothetical protein